MSSSWSNFFQLVEDIICEANVKSFTTSLRTIDSFCGKIEHCIRNFTRLTDITERAIEDEDDFQPEFVYLKCNLESLLEFLHDVYHMWNAKLTTADSKCNVASLHHAVMSVRSSLPGRPGFFINSDIIFFLRSINFKWIDIAKLMGVSQSTLYRKCSELGIVGGSDNHDHVTYNELLLVVVEVKNEFPEVRERILLCMYNNNINNNDNNTCNRYFTQ